VDSRPAFAWTERAHHMGQLSKGTGHWDVHLEMRADDDKRTHWGRLHFTSGDRHRQSAWIFLEYSEKEIRERFADFSSTELWALLDSLAP